MAKKKKELFEILGDSVRKKAGSAPAKDAEKDSGKKGPESDGRAEKAEKTDTETVEAPAALTVREALKKGVDGPKTGPLPIEKGRELGTFDASGMARAYQKYSYPAESGLTSGLGELPERKGLVLHYDVILFCVLFVLILLISAFIAGVKLAPVPEETEEVAVVEGPVGDIAEDGFDATLPEDHSAGTPLAQGERELATEILTAVTGWKYTIVCGEVRYSVAAAGEFVKDRDWLRSNGFPEAFLLKDIRGRLFLCVGKFNDTSYADLRSRLKATGYKGCKDAYFRQL